MRKLSTYLYLVISFVFCSSALAQKLENTYKDWNVLTTVINSKKVCYIASTPVSKDGTVAKRNDPYILVSWFDGRKPEVSISAGYHYKKGSGVRFTTDKQQFLLTKIQGELAWTNREEEDRKLVSAMKSDLTLEVYAESEDSSQYSIDNYSLRGFTKSFEEMIKLCENREEPNNTPEEIPSMGVVDPNNIMEENE